MLLASFNFFKCGPKKDEIAYVSHIMFSLDSTALEPHITY